MGKVYRDLVRAHSQAKGSARNLLNVLADYATDDDGLAWPGRAALASDTGMSERTVVRCLQTLCEQRRISLVDHGRGGRGNKPVYKIWMPEIGQPAPLEDADAPPERVSDCHPLAQEGEAEKGVRLSQRVPECHPLDAQRVTNGHVKGDNVTIKGDKCAPNPSYARSEPQEPQLEPKGDPQKRVGTQMTPIDFGNGMPRQRYAKQRIDGIVARYKALGLSSPEFNTLVDTVLAGMNKLDIADLDTTQANREHASAQECALALAKKDYRTAEKVKRLFESWYEYDWRGQKGELPTYELLIDHAAALPRLVEAARNGANNGNHTRNNPTDYQRPAAATFTQAEWREYAAQKREELPF